MKPWRDCSDVERLDSQNGLPFVATMDALFDAYMITFTHDGSTIISRALSSTEKDGLQIPASLRQPLSEKQRDYLSWHRAEFERVEAVRSTAMPSLVPKARLIPPVA
jgi:hypothetical protein